MIKKLLYSILALLGFIAITATCAFFWLVVINPGDRIDQANIERLLSMESPVYYKDGQNKIGVFFQEPMWDGWLECDPDEIYFYDLAYSEVATEAIANALGPNEDPYEFVCRRDPETLVCAEACVTCPFMAGCFGLNLLELEAETQQILEGDYDAS